MKRDTDKPSIENSVSLFLKWLDLNGYESYDPYNLWSSRFGLFAKSLYLRNKIAGAPLVSAVVIADIIAPKLSRVLSPKNRFPIADAHFILSFCNLFKSTGNLYYLRLAQSIAEKLLGQSLIRNHSGHCWGYPFDWMTNQGLWKSSTPLITTTPYCFEAFLSLFDCTSDSRYSDIAMSISRFAQYDLNETIIDEASTACSYSPIDSTLVINANAYRAMVLTETWKRFGSDKLLSSAKCNINFIIDAQQEDGSWWYAMNNSSDQFIDNFHTCLVLKNLVKVNRVIGSKKLWQVIERGYNYYLNNLIDTSGEPKPFAHLKRVNLVSRELYDYAEGITLANLIIKYYPSNLDSTLIKNKAQLLLTQLCAKLICSYQLADGHFVTKEYFGLIRNTTPYIRWAQAQLFYSLTTTLLAQSDTAILKSQYATSFTSQ
jgi:hypothetical protein